MSLLTLTCLESAKKEGEWLIAERRMFTKKVTDDDNFMQLSSSSQALYLHLSMCADDDGFCNQVTICMFKAHASIQDLQTLLEKRYIYQFENGVIVIKHWRMANALRKDRYTPTAFQKELAQLQIKDNGSYTFKDNGCQVVAKCLPQDRLGKDSIDKINKDICSNGFEREQYFERFWKEYPKKIAKANAKKSFIKKCNNEETFNSIMNGLAKQKKSPDWIKDNGKFIPHPTTWLNGERWNDEMTIDISNQTSSCYNITKFDI